jgi:hypothetical protein
VRLQFSILSLLLLCILVAAIAYLFKPGSVAVSFAWERTIQEQDPEQNGRLVDVANLRIKNTSRDAVWYEGAPGKPTYYCSTLSKGSWGVYGWSVQPCPTSRLIAGEEFQLHVPIGNDVTAIKFSIHVTSCWYKGCDTWIISDELKRP